MEAAANIIFDDDEDIGVQAAALKSYLTSLEAHSVKMETKTGDEFTCYTIAPDFAGGVRETSKATGIIDSGASATFVTSDDKVSNQTTRRAQLLMVKAVTRLISENRSTNCKQGKSFTSSSCANV